MEKEKEVLTSRPKRCEAQKKEEEKQEDDTSGPIYPVGKLSPVSSIGKSNVIIENIVQLEFVFYVKTDVSTYLSDAVLYRKSGFGTAKGYKLRK